MGGKEKIEPKVKLDNDDILSDLGLTSDKVEIDTDGLAVREDFLDKAVLEKEGVFDEEVPAELEIAVKKKPDKAEEKKEKFAALKKAVENKLRAYSEKFKIQLSAFSEKIKIKQLPWLKISAAAGGAGVLCCLGWFLISFFTSSKAPEEDFEKPKAAIVEEVKQEAAEGQAGKEIDLEAFIIPVLDNRKQASFLRISVRLNLRFNVDDELNKEAKNIRTTIYNFISNKGAQEFLDEEKRGAVAGEIQKLLNTLIKKDAIQHVSLINILLV